MRSAPRPRSVISTLRARCHFYLAPTHIPSDLQGITSGTYEANRDDRDWNSAVGPFCNEVRTQIRKLGLAPGAVHETIREMAAKFEGCDWIENNDNRVKRKITIVDEMISFCKNNAVSKRRLLAQNRTGFNMALCAAIRASPHNGDAGLLLAVKPQGFTRGVTQGTVIGTIEMLEKERKITRTEALNLTSWLNQLQNVHQDDQRRIEELLDRMK